MNSLPRAALMTLVVLSACIDTPTEPPVEPIGEGRRALFIGNSYLYAQDIPGIVQALADSAGGDQIAVGTVAYPDAALSDHLRSGAALPSIRSVSWEWVILQQGPSSVLVNRDSLRQSTAEFAAEIESIGARPALFSAWPSSSRRQDFPAAIESYRLAAEDVGGLFLPVAGAWLEAWERDPDVILYADAVHPSVAGAYLAALVIYARLLEASPIGLPASFRTRAGVTVTLPLPLAEMLQAAALAATAETSPSLSRR